MFSQIRLSYPCKTNIKERVVLYAFHFPMALTDPVLLTNSTLTGLVLVTNLLQVLEMLGAILQIWV